MLAESASARTAELVAALRGAGPSGLLGPSGLEGWSRLTVSCHLRYGARASTWMTVDGLAGRPTAFYPGGRARDRPATLAPGPGEDPLDVVASLEQASGALDAEWRGLSVADWSTVVEEPAGTADLGPVTLVTLALLRLTEVEVHGTDLDLGLGDWSEKFVTHALAHRLEWLATRRTNHRPTDADVDGTWLLVASDGPARLVGVHRDRVTSEPAAEGTAADAVIEGSSRDLLALLLGRAARGTLRLGGDLDRARSFSRAFPGP